MKAPDEATRRGEPTGSSHRINLTWLVKLRWGAIVGQVLTIAVVHGPMAMPLPLPPLLALVSVAAVSNAAVLAWLRLGRPVPEWLVPATMAADVVLLTGLLVFTGGPFNPFNFLYLVHIALAAVVLRAAWTWALVVLSLACSGALFFVNPDFSDPAAHQRHMRMHLEGMWIACAVAAGFIVYFVTRVRRALALREADLAAERATAVRNERLAALATLSAGAAHELATPLGTIAVVARELERQAERGHAGSLEDVRLIRAQVERCRAILDQMAADAGESAGEAIAPATVQALVHAAVRDLPREPEVDARLEAEVGRCEVLVPVRALAQALRAVIKNAQEASSDAPVVLEAERAGDEVRLRVTDRGPGMPAAVLARVGEPFYTTKPPGQGMGLGIFLARTVVERLGGRLTITSASGRGTVVTIALPSAEATARGRLAIRA